MKATAILLTLLALASPALLQGESGSELFDLELLFAKPRIQSVVLSPAGDRVAYVLREDDGVSVWLLEAEDRSRHKLFDAREIEGLTWSPDGGGLFFEVGPRVGYVPARSSGERDRSSEGSPPRPRFVVQLDPLREQKLAGVDPSRPHHVLVTEKAGETSYRLLRFSREAETEVVYESDQPVGSFVVEGVGADNREGLAFVTETDGKVVSVLRITDEQRRELLRCGLEDACGLQFAREWGGRLYFTGRYGGDLWRLQALDWKAGTAAGGSRRENSLTTVHEDPEGLADLSSVVFDPRSGVPLMARYATDRLRGYGLTPEVRSHRAVLEKHFGDRDLRVEPRAGGPYWLVEESGARLHHARYHLYDTRRGSVTPILEDERQKVASLPEDKLAEKRFFSYRAGDGMEVHGFVSVPLGARSLESTPVVVRVHGGPWNRVGPGFVPATQFLVNRGYIVFEPDFRASNGYGWKYLSAGRGEFGDGQVQQDIIDGLDHLLAQGIGDPRKVVIMGHSFGGYATLEGLASHGDRFRAGIASAPPIDLVRSLSDLDDEATVANGILQKKVVFDLLVDMSNPTALDDLRRRSPEARVQRIKRPLLIYAGGEDERVSLVEVKHLASALEAQGTDVSLLVDDEAGHSFDRVLMQKATLYLSERFLAYHLGGAVGTIEDDRLQAYLEANLRLKGESLAAALAALAPVFPAAGVGEVIPEIPSTPDPGQRYLFYLHGAIIESSGERPTHPIFGTYEYRAIVNALAEGGSVVISEARSEGTDADAYAAEVAGQVRALLAAGVPESAITVVGFSKGGAIAVRVSTLLGNEKLGFVLLGSCGAWVFQPDIRVSGRILSIYEATDTIAGSCEPLFANAAKLSAQKEIRIETGKKHGAFYAPRKEWMDPTIAWAAHATAQ